MTNLNFEHIAIHENHDPMVDIADYPFVAAPVYFEQGYSDTPKLYTRQMIADRLLQLQDSVLTGYQFKIWDPWRSRKV